MNAKQKTVYIADDGTQWDHEFEMKFRDEEIKQEKLVNEWLEEVQMKPSTATRAKTAIMEFYNWNRKLDS